MSTPEPTTLPTELIEEIIDEVFHSQSSTDTRSEMIMIDPQALSSLACVSHAFRQRVNAHRFSIVSFYRKNLSLHYIHTFLDLLRLDVWVTPSMGVARHVRKLVLILGDRGSGDWDKRVRHRAVDDGSLTMIMNTVFRGGEGYPYPTSDYTLALCGLPEWERSYNLNWLSWETVNQNRDFISNLESLLDSSITTLDLTKLSAVPPMLMKRRRIKHLKISGSISFSLTPQHISDFNASGPWNHLESLNITRAHPFNIVDPGDGIPMLKALTVGLLDSSIAGSISNHWRHWSMLEDLTFNIDHDHIIAMFRVDYSSLPTLKRLTINLQLLNYNSKTSEIEVSTQQILNILGPNIPSLSLLKIFIDTKFYVLPQYQDIGFANDIVLQINCASIDSVLALHHHAISTIIIQFGIKLSRGIGDDLDLETFRKEGLDVLREAFPRLNAVPQPVIRSRLCMDFMTMVPIVHITVVSLCQSHKNTAFGKQF